MNKKQFYDLLKPLIEIYDSIEKELILDILERIDNYDGIKGTLKWYLDKLIELKAIDKDATFIFKENKAEIKEALKNILKESSKKSISIDTLESYNKHFNKNVSLSDIYDSESATNLIKEAFKSTENICNLINTKAIESTKKVYQTILNTAYIETSSGVYTYDQSIKKAIDKMGKEGILLANYDSGRSISIESAVRRDIVTRVNQLVGDIELTTATEIMKTNFVYVDQHIGARTRTKYTKADYEAHDEWQGKVYMIKGSNDKYDNFYEKTGYGKMLGLKGINCYHNFRPYFEWESIPKPIDIEESRKERELLDTQREFERNIRSLKRQKIVDKKMGYDEAYKKTSSKLLKVNNEYNAWLNETDKMRNTNREYVSKNMNIFKNSQYKKEINKMVVGQFDISKYTDRIKTTTNDVILTPERKQHIIDRHIEVTNYLNKIEDILNNPDAIYKQISKEDTIWLVKTFDKNVKITIKLNTINNVIEKDYKNSIINMQIMNEKKINKYLEQEKILELFDKNNKK